MINKYFIVIFILSNLIQLSCNQNNSYEVSRKEKIEIDSISYQFTTVTNTIPQDTTIFTDLETALKNPLAVKRLALSPAKFRFTSLPEEIFELTNLEYFSIESCRIKEISPRISEFQNLKVLDISFNEFKELPSEIVQLKKLEKLVVNDCSWLESLPNELSNLERLKYLSLSLSLHHNKDFLAPICGLENLEFLNISKTGIEVIPPAIGQLKNLKELHINNTRLSVLPKEFGELESLEKLIMINTKIKDVPDELKNLRNLDYAFIGWDSKSVIQKFNKWFPDSEIIN